MTLVNAETGEIIAECTAEEARALTDRIKVGVEAVWHLVAEAYQRRAWAALGFASWDDYTTREFGTSRLRLPREDRQEVVASLRDAGLSIRAIASATGNSQVTVQSDLRTVAQVYQTDTPAEVASYPEAVAGNGAAASTPPAGPAPLPATQITGTDGKTYSIPQSRGPKRSPLGDVARSAGWDLRKSVERIERVFADDRFPANEGQVTAALRSHLSYTVEVCQDLLDRYGQ